MIIKSKERCAVTLLFYINGLITGSWAIQIAQFAPRFNVTDQVISYFILTFGFGALIMMPVSGILMVKFGSRQTVRVSALLASGALICVGFMDQIFSLIFSLFALGAMIGTMNVTMNSNAVVLEKALSKAILSSCHCFWSVGLFTAGLIGGYIVEQYGFFIHTLFSGCIAILLTLLATPYIYKDPPTEKTNISQKKHLPNSATIYVIGLMAIMSMIPECAVVDWSSRYLLKDLNATTEIASFAFAFFAATMAFFRLIGDVIRDKFDSVLIIRVSALTTAISLIAASILTNPWQVITAFAIAGIGIANLIPIIFSAAGSQQGVQTSTGMTIVTTLGYLGTLLAPAPIGYLADILGFPIVYAGLGAMLLFLFLLAPKVRITN